MKKKIGTFALGMVLGLSIVACACAQDNGVGGAPPGTTGVGPGVGLGQNTTRGPVGERTQPNTPNVNPAAPNSDPQSPETRVSPQPQDTGPINGVR
jgi:hypothetical protein